MRERLPRQVGGFELAAAAASTPVLHCHGVVDEVVRIGWARESVELKEMGVKDYTLKEYRPSATAPTWRSSTTCRLLRAAAQ